MLKQIVIDVEEEKRARFKSKLAAESLTMREVLSWAIDDYLAGTWKPRPHDRQKGKN